MSVASHKSPSNRLSREKSPYLLQHASNPVDWYPWGEEAFAKARQEDKPVFLSIGYSTCYWCHVMEKESYDDPAIARLMNERFVSIKVDREERPDIDAIYMAAVQAMSGSGGWPLNLFLTPEGQPFWGGTYFPPEDRWGRVGFPTVLRSIAEAWRSRRDEILGSSRSLTQLIQSSAQATPGDPPTSELLEAALRDFGAQYDSVHGGFGEAPKFPRSHSLSFLLRVWLRTSGSRALEMVDSTLEAMAQGGLHDQLGGGFHRYATDAAWRVPHFEKMLYDQALLARTYVEAYQLTGKASYAAIARGIFDYVLRDLQDPQGGFYCAEDAGEVGREGEFYVWTTAQVEAALGGEEAALIARYYGLSEAGNFEKGANVLYIPKPLEAFAKEEGLSAEEARQRLEAARGRLLEARAKRPRPHRDDKILTDWNGLMIGALAYGARALDEPRYAMAARQAAKTLLVRLQSDGSLLHRYRDKEAAIAGFLDDYAFLAGGLLDLYEATFEPQWLEQSQRLAKEMVRLFWDESEGGFFFSGERNELLIARTKELYDGATPSGNSIAALTLLRLAALTMDRQLEAFAERLLSVFSATAHRMPQAVPQLLIAIDFWLGPSQEIVIAGDPSAEALRQMVRMAHERFLPRSVLALHPSGESAASIERLVPFIKEQVALEGKPTAYVCENYVCRLPTTNPAQFRALLSERAAP